MNWWQWIIVSWLAMGALAGVVRHMRWDYKYPPTPSSDPLDEIAGLVKFFMIDIGFGAITGPLNVLFVLVDW